MLMVEPGSDPANATDREGQGRRRVQIDFSPAAYARLDSIRERSDDPGHSYFSSLLFGRDGAFVA